MLLVALGSSVITDVTDAHASDHVLKDVPNGISETSTIKESEKEAQNVNLLYLRFFLKVL